MSIARTLVIKTAALPPVESIVRKSFLFKPLVSRFIAGDQLAESLDVSKKILADGLRVSLDYLGENTANEAEALQAKTTYKKMLSEIDAVSEVKAWKASAQTDKEPLNISIKLTQCGLDQGIDFAEANYREVVTLGAELGNFVRVDMEGSDYTQRTIDIVSKMHKEMPNTGTVLQSYLRRNDEDVEFMIENKIRTRLVKGAYLESSTVAFPEKSVVDEKYVAQAKRLLKDGTYPAIATQDEAIILELKKYVQENGIDPKSFEWQMLLGIRRDLQSSLTTEGFNVRIYVPFGDSWYPYFTRRLAERPANAFFILKSLFKK